jgi:hypothetical protein
MATQRQPVFRAMALAFGMTDPTTGRASIDQAALEGLGGGRMSFSALAERMSQQLGTGAGGTTKMLTLMANQGKLQGDMMQHQGQMLRGLTDDLLRQANMEVTDGTRMFVMQRAFGIGEAESRALVQGLPMEAASRKRLEEESTKLDGDVKQAVATAQTGVARQITEVVRGIKEGFADIVDPWVDKLSRMLVPEVREVRDRLDTLNSRIGPMMRSNSPISTGPIEFGPHHDQWMIPADPMTMQGFRAASTAGRYPAAMVSMSVKPPSMAEIDRLTSPNVLMEKMAG